MKVTGFGSLKILAGAATLALGGGLAAQTPAAEQAAGGETAAPQEEARGADELICKRIRDVTSRARKNKVCLTKKQWIAVARNGNSVARSIVAGAAGGMWDVLERDNGAM